jgi:hypothetical protein
LYKRPGCPTENFGHDGKAIVRSQFLVNFNIDMAFMLEGRFVKHLTLFINNCYATDGLNRSKTLYSAANCIVTRYLVFFIEEDSPGSIQQKFNWKLKEKAV